MATTLPETEDMSSITKTTATQGVTYLLSINDSDLLRLYEEREANRALYVHSYVDIIGLAILTLMSFTSNAALAAILVQSLTPFRVALLSLTALHIVDGVFDAAIAIAYMTRVIWDFGLVLCQVNAFVIQTWLLVLPTTLLHAGIVILDVTFSGAAHQRSKQIRRHVWSVLTTWVLGSLMVLLLLHLRWLEVRPYPARMACSLGPISAFDGLTFSWILITGVCIVPVVSLSIIAVKCIHLLWQDQQSKRRIGHFSNADVKRRRLSRQDIRSLFVTWLVLFTGYLIGAVPYAVHTYVDAIHAPSNGTRFEVCHTPQMDVLVAWLRLVVTCSHPIIVFIFEDDLRNELRLIVLWWHRPRPPVDETAMIKVSQEQTHCKKLIIDLNFIVPRKGHGDGDKADDKYDPLLPVLFLSHQGLCLRRPHLASAEDSTQFGCYFRDVIADCCRQESLVKEQQQQPQVQKQERQQPQVQQLQPQQLQQQSFQIYHQTTVGNKMIQTRSFKERDMKLGIWPQAARFSGPRTNDHLREHDSKNQKVRPASRHLIT